MCMFGMSRWWLAPCHSTPLLPGTCMHVPGASEALPACFDATDRRGGNNTCNRVMVNDMYHLPHDNREMTPEEQKAAEEKKAMIEKAKARGAEKAKLTKSMIIMDVKPWDDTTGMPRDTLSSERGL